MEDDPTSILLRNLVFNHSNMRSDRIVEKLQDDDPTIVLVALENLSSTLLMSREEGLVTFPTAAVLPELTRILREPPPVPEILVLSARVITQLIDRGVPDVLEQLLDCGILDALKLRFQDIGYIDLVEQAIVILERLAHEFPVDVLASECPQLCLQFIDFFNMHIQKSILTIIVVCCSTISSENLETVKMIVPIIEEHMANCNQSLADLSISGMCTIIAAMAHSSDDNKREIRNTFSDKVVVILSGRITLNDPLLYKVLKALNVLVEHMPHLVPELIKTRVPSAIAYAVTQVSDLTQPFDSNEVISALLHCPKDALLAANRLLSSLLPTPSINLPFSGPFQQVKNGVDKQVLNDIPSEDFKTFVAIVVQLATLIQSGCADATIREQAITNVLQISSSLPRKILKAIAESSDIVLFVCHCVSQADTLNLTIGGLLVADQLVSKLPDVFAPAFAQQGIISELEAIIAGCPYPDAKLPKSFTSDSTGLDAVASFVARKVLDQVNAVVPQAPLTSTEALLRLKNGDSTAWPEVSALIHDKPMFELLRIDAFNIITNAILSNSEAFTQVFTPQKFKELVSKAEEALSRNERCGVLSSSSGGTPTLANAINHHIRIRLKDNDNNTSWPLNVQGIASIKNLEDFCISRLAFFQFISGDNNLFDELANTRRRRNGDRHDDDDDESIQSEEGHMHEDEDDEDVDNEEDRYSEEDRIEGTGHRDDDEDDDDDLHSLYSEDDDMNPDQLQMSVEERPLEEAGDEDAEEEDDDSEAGNGDDLIELERDTADAEEALADDMDIAGAIGRLHGTTGLLGGEKPKLKFYYQGKELSPDMSVLGALYSPAATLETDTTLPRNLWSDEFTINFERTETPLTDKHVLTSEAIEPFQQIPQSMGSNPHLLATMRLLNVLYALNERNGFIKRSDFVNIKLTSKLNRQLEDPLIVVGSILPRWVVDTVRTYPFLYHLETRHAFIKSTSFGHARSMSRWRSRSTENGAPLPPRINAMGRVAKQKYRISRKGLLSNALKVLKLTSQITSMVEIEYYHEQGTGLGPTLEFYSNVSKEFQRSATHMWRGENVNGYMFESNGLFPAPMVKHDKKILNFFKGLGRFLARALLDERLLDLRINPAFFALVLHHKFYEPWDLLRLVDGGFADQLQGLEKQTVESLELDFTLPGYDHIELLPGGKDQLVTGARLEEYRDYVLDWTVGKGVSRQVDAFCEGFNECIPITALNALLPSDFSALCGQNQESWDETTLRTYIKADHGYTMESPPVLELIKLMSTFDQKQRRRFLQFMTGSPNLPIGGFKTLEPAFTIVMKHGEDENLGADDYFPSVMTCANYLKLPAYTSREVMSKRLWAAIDGGSGVFPLS